MKKLLTVLMTLVISCLLASGCTTGERKDAGMVTGGVLGGVAGSYLTGGSPAGAIVGAVGGGYVGRQLAN